VPVTSLIVQMGKAPTRDQWTSVGLTIWSIALSWLGLHLEQRIVGRHKADVTVKHSKVTANFFGCFLIAFVDKKIGAIVFPIHSLRHGFNISDWSDPIGDRAIMLSNYVSSVIGAAPNVGPIIGCLLRPSDCHPDFVDVEKLRSNRGDQEFAPL
jgi:hypothetical protein